MPASGLGAAPGPPQPSTSAVHRDWVLSTCRRPKVMGRSFCVPFHSYHVYARPRAREESA